MNTIRELALIYTLMMFSTRSDSNVLSKKPKHQSETERFSTPKTKHSSHIIRNVNILEMQILCLSKQNCLTNISIYYVYLKVKISICTNVSKHFFTMMTLLIYVPFYLNRKWRRQCRRLVTKMNCFNIQLVRACTVVFVPMSSKIQSCAIMNIYFVELVSPHISCTLKHAQHVCNHSLSKH